MERDDGTDAHHGDDSGGSRGPVIAHAGEWVQYSTPDGAEYVAVCLPAFAPGIVHRDE